MFLNGQKKKIQDILDGLSKQNKAITIRRLASPNGEITIVFIKHISDRVSISELIIRPFLMHCESLEKITADYALSNILFVDDLVTDSDIDKIVGYVYNGQTVILFENDRNYIVANMKKVEKKSLSEPELTFTMRGPRDPFVENMDSNLSLLRYRIKDPKLSIDTLEVGARTKTKVAVAYIDDIANKDLVAEVERRINSINIDGILDSGDLQKFILDGAADLYPQTGIVERSDMASAAILEGKVLMLVEGSPTGLIAPKLFNEYFTSCDDIYDNTYFQTFNGILRRVAIFFSLTITSIYVSMVSFNSDAVPTEYLVALAQSRAGVPFNALTEALLGELLLEVLREALLRAPKQVGPAIGIVGAIVIGQAAIAAGIFSPLLLIFISISLLTSYVAPDYTVSNPFRIIKYALLILAGMFGFYGFTLGLSVIVVGLISAKSFGIPYLAPFAPFRWRDFIKGVVISKRTSPYRPGFLKTIDNTRGPTDKK